MHSSDQFLIVGGSFVCAVWVWLAVRTTHCLRTVTRGAVPFSARKIWFVKILAVVVGAGNVSGLLVQAGLPWPASILLAAIVVVVALRDSVTPIVVLPPPQAEATYKSAWDRYRQLHKRAVRYGLALLGVFGIMVLSARVRLTFSTKLGDGLWGLFVVASLVLFLLLSYQNALLQQWQCPRCGKRFRGVLGRPWMPKRCVYCGLERWGSVSSGERR